MEEMNDSQWKVFHSDENIQSVSGPPPEWTELTNMDTQNLVFENWNNFNLSLTEAASVLSSDPTTVESRTWSCHYNSNSSTFIKDKSTDSCFSIVSYPKTIVFQSVIESSKLDASIIKCKIGKT